MVDIEDFPQKRTGRNIYFAGVTDDMAEIKLWAKSAYTTQTRQQHILAQEISSYIEPLAGGVYHIVSDKAEINQFDFIATFTENVVIMTNDGYQLTTEILEARFDSLFARIPVTVRGSGPLGNIRANHMLLSSDDEHGGAHLVFSGDVKVVYNPPDTEEE